MNDRFQREIKYMRISITERCNLKCIYCSPHEEDQCLNQRENYLTPDEIHRVVKIVASLGITKIRVTGGEPLIREDVCEIVEKIASVKEIEDISLTTNGVNLDKKVDKLKEAGLMRLNISLDSLKEERFSYITGGGKLNKTLRGIERSLELGLNPVKINTVLIRGVNDDEVEDFINLAKDLPLQVRFIELMPIGKYGEENSDKIVTSEEIIEKYPMLKFDYKSNKGQPATYYTIDGYKGKIGFISPMSHKFCSTCNRIRLTCDGKIKPCLGDNREVDIINILRKEDQYELEKIIRETILNKPRGHNFKEEFSSLRSMNRIGG